MQEQAYAKVNLALHVRGREPGGYHRLETLFAFCEDGDTLAVAPGEGLSLTVAGPFAAALGDEPDNLVLRAARALATRFGVSAGAALHLEKSLPVASGIGGGSADAAAALRLLSRWWGLDAPEAALLEIAAGLGADVPACVRSETVRGEGKGDRLVPQPGSGLAGVPLLLVNPRVPVPTGPVFAGWDGIDRGPLADIDSGGNDLEAPAIAIAPVIRDVLSALRAQAGTRLVRMSGSGATCFALFADDAARDAAAAALSGAHPDWWLLPTRLR
jgi:4-diphosphocytidyl-2-C-methyl-D-erythritol kinase